MSVMVMLECFHQQRQWMERQRYMCPSKKLTCKRNNLFACQTGTLTPDDVMSWSTWKSIIDTQWSSSWPNLGSSLTGKYIYIDVVRSYFVFHGRIHPSRQLY
jgi:hypothetical protein